MMQTSLFSVFLMMFAGGGIGNDLLDFVPAEAYFKLAGIEMSVEALTEVLDAPPAKEAAARPGDSARRQLALRSLGELKDKAALPSIEKHLASDDPLVADYAKAARASIKGEPYQRPAPSRDLLRQDLACLPSGIGVIGRISATPGAGGVDVINQIGDLIAEMREQGGADKLDEAELREMEAEIVREMGQLISLVGNVRLGAITVGVASELGNDRGFVIGLARGLYDHKAVASLLDDRLDGARLEVGGLKYYEVERGNMYIAPVSDELFVFAAGASLEEIPLAEVAEKVVAGGGDFAIGKDLAMLLDRADTSAPIWALMKVSEAYKEAEFLAPFDTVVLQGKETEDGKATLTATGKGADAEAIAAVVEQLNGGLEEAREEIAREVGRFPPAAIFKEILESVTITSEGGTAVLSADLPEGGAMSTLPMMFLGWMAPIPVPAEPPVEAVPEIAPDPEPAVPE